MSHMQMLLPYRKKGSQIQYLVKNAYVPGWDQHPDLCGISVLGNDPNHEVIMLENLANETGIVIEEEELIRLGVCAIKRSSDLVCNMFAVDLSKRLSEAVTTSPDYFWIDDDKMMESIDPQLLSCYAKLRYLVL